MAKGRRRAFTNEFKAQTEGLVRDSGKSSGVIAESWTSARAGFGIGSGKRRWMRAGGARAR